MPITPSNSYARQRELPLLVDVNRQASAVAPQERRETRHSRPVATDFFHKSASVADQAIYNAISDNYFKGRDLDARKSTTPA